ncbi:MAG TPA: DUF2017 family protein [Acidimicrobiales bacterium]|nr:DUF2017 family protein [Acidimicrobiales bacterium]
MKRVKRRAADRFRIKLPSNEQLLLTELVDQLHDQLSGSTDEPHLRRLFPPAYANDAERDAGYQVLTRDELLERKMQAIAVVRRTLTGGDLDSEELGAWMTIINSMRLVLGTRLDVDEDPVVPDADDPLALPYAVYEYLGVLLYQVVEALGDDLPPPTATSN